MSIGLKLKVTQESPFRRDSLFKLFEDIQAAGGRNDKMKLVATADEKQKALIELALNPYKQFHITSWHDGAFGSWKDDDEAYSKFIELCEYAQKTNHCSELRDSFTVFFSKCNYQQKEWFNRIIQKELKIGILAKSINKVFPDLIPGMEVMLAFKAETDLSNVDFKRRLIVERKLDGFRLLVFFHQIGVVEIIGRSGKELPNEELNSRLEQLIIDQPSLSGWVADGEAYCKSMNFEQISSVLRSERRSLPTDMRLEIFDAMKVKDYNEQNFGKCSNDILEQRISNRESIAESCPELFHALQWYPVNTAEQVMEYYSQFIEEGYEGAMIKDLDSYYEWKRSKHMLKVKPEDFADVQISEAYEGNGAIVGMLGGFICHDEKGIEVRVGGGYKLWERQEFWEKRNEMIGKWIKCKFTQRTAADRFRHPNFRGLRTDR